MRSKRLTLVLIFIITLISTACGSTPETPPTDSEGVSAVENAAAEPDNEVAADEIETITLMSHNSFNVSEDVLNNFEATHKIKVKLLPSGDAGAALNQAILSKENPLADVFFGVDNAFLSRAINAEIFEPYPSPLLADVDDSLKLDPESRLLPVDYGDVCFNYDKAWFAAKGLAPPATLEDLIRKEYSGLTVIQNPATSSPGLAFLLATIVHFGQDDYLAYWQQLKDNDVLVTNGWEEAYYSQFTRYEGERPIVLSYASSPPAEVIFAEETLDDAPTASVLGAESCFRQIEFAGILSGTAKREAAEKLIDFLLSLEFQEDLPMTMFVFPANQKAALPETFVKYAELAPHPATLPPDIIAANREDWINSWTETVLR